MASLLAARPRARRPFRSLLVSALVAALAVSGVTVASAPPAGAAVQNIAFESVNNNRVVLGSLASRSQRKPVTISGIGPYTIRGTDSLTQQSYDFATDFFYNPSTPAWGRESDERTLSAAGGYSSNANAAFSGRSGVLQLSSTGNCTANAQTNVTYCSSFGPDVYTAPFTATVGQAVSFDWAAQRIQDDYEIYAYLVRVDGNGYGSAATSTLLTYGRGDTQGWTTTSGNIPADGTYRFRFVNGTYDKTGGLAIGSNMYIDSVVKLGLSNPISFPAVSDQVVGNPPFAVTASAPGGAVTFRTSTTTVCTVTPTGTVSLTGNTGTCVLVANQAGDADYVPAETATQSFRVLSAPTAPLNAGRPYITGTIADGRTVTANEGTWTDGGSPITGTAFQWVSTVGGTTTPVSGATDATCVLIASPGSSLQVTVTKTNAIGSTSATSLALSDHVCAAATPPQWAGESLGAAEVGTALSVPFVATGRPAAVYSVVAGALPDGLTLDATTGTVSGTPTQEGAYAFTLRATNSAGTADLPVSGTVLRAPGPITGSPGALVVGTAATGSVASDGTPAPGYVVSAGALPAGVTLDPATGEFSGTPTAAGAYSFEITASNGVGAPATRTFTGTVDQAPGWIARGLSPEVGIAVDVTFTSTGSPPPTYSIGSGALPAGLALDARTGRITGTPPQPGPFAFTIVATNSVGSASLPVSGTVTEAPGPITGGPGAWIVGTAADGAVASTGTPDPVYSVTDGALPDGVTLDPVTGAFGGTPTTSGAYDVTVTASNGVGSPASRQYTGTVAEAPAWGPAPGLALIVGTAMTPEVFAASGTPAPTYALAAGTLPAGLTFDSVTGTLSGTPTADGPYAFTLSATNGIGDTALLEITGIVDSAPVWRDVALVSPRVGTAYVDGVSADGTSAPTYSVTEGSLPPGLTLDAQTGALTGTPTEAGTFPFTITASNGVGAPAVQAFELEVVQVPSADSTTATRRSAVAGSSLSIDLGAGVTASPAPTYRLTAGELPSGLTLDPETGEVSGTPTTPGVYSFTVTADNGTGEVLALEVTITVAAAVAPDAAPGLLALTGMGSVAPALVVTAILVAGGLLLLVLGRRRRRRI